MLLPALLHWTLLLLGLASQSLWIDEWFTADIVRSSWPAFLSHIVQTERRPPLHYTLLKLWSSFAGDGEFGQRLFSAMLALLSLAILYTLGRRVLGHRTGLCAAVLLACSPFFILYGRMVRAYSQTMLLGALATWLLLRAFDKPTFWRWLFYGLAALALLYTDYSGLAVLGSHAFYTAAQGASRRSAIRWLSTISAVGLGYLPWLPFALVHTEHPARLTDLATGVVGFGLKLAYPFFAWGAGETIFPWHPAAPPGVILCGLLLMLGLVFLIREGRPAFWLLTGWLVVPLLFTAVLLTFVATDIPFVNAASRGLAAAPAFYLSVATGLSALRRRQLSLLAALCIGVTFSVALFNYYHGWQFHNPIYAVPIRQVVEELRTASGPDDLIVAEADTLFGYYYQQAPGLAAYQDADFKSNQAWIEAKSPARVWLLTFGRDSTAGTGQTEELANWLAAHYSNVQSWGYVPQDPIYRAVKERLLGRPAYAYKLLIRIYASP